MLNLLECGVCAGVVCAVLVEPADVGEKKAEWAEDDNEEDVVASEAVVGPRVWDDEEPKVTS